MRTSDFDYELPPELIAQEPPVKRDESKMLLLDPARPTDQCPIVTFSHFPEFLEPGDVVVRNDTKVIPARLFAQKETGAKIEILLLSPATDGTWNSFLRPAKRVQPGAKLRLFSAPEGENLSDWEIELVEKNPDGTCRVAFAPGEEDRVLRECGHLPLPPYIRRSDTPMDSERYQTVYAHVPGAVAAPTAGLHFTPGIFDELSKKGVLLANLTLHVGAGTFKPVEAEDVEAHRMHSETYVFPRETADLLNKVRADGHRILAVGTTTLRTLESCVRDDGTFAPGAGETSIFIHPPYRIKSADMLLTNFHLPKSTLLMLVSAFAGMDAVRLAYQCAVRERMRFFSYGDCMLIQGKI